MKIEGTMLLKYLKVNLFDKMDKYSNYRKYGFEFYIVDSFLIIIYKGKEYRITIIKKNNIYYLYMNPFKNSYFITKLNRKVNDIDLILKLIKQDYLFTTKK